MQRFFRADASTVGSRAAAGLFSKTLLIFFAAYAKMNQTNEKGEHFVMQTLILHKHKARVPVVFDPPKTDPLAPKPFEGAGDALPRLTLPLPFPKSSVRHVARAGAAYWIASDRGLARYCPAEEDVYDRMMYFSADRDLPDNDVRGLAAEEDACRVLTATGSAHIRLVMMSMAEKAAMLADESKTVIDRFGMISHNHLEKDRDLSTKLPHNDCDNDGGFTAACCIGEICRYAVLRDGGKTDPAELADVRKGAMRMLEACLLLMYITGRADHFPARTYIVKDYPVPDDGLFFARKGKTATCCDTTFSREKGICGKTYPCEGEIPDRLRKLYADAGYTDDDVIFKTDTSSDEVTLHVVNLWYALRVFGEEDPELAGMIRDCVRGVLHSIIDHGFELYDFTGEPTSWAKWSERYFTSGIGWCDAPENAAEIMMYLKLAMDMLPGDEKLEAAYAQLKKLDYPSLFPLHYARAFQTGVGIRREVVEDLMYGDHMLINLSLYGLLLRETDPHIRACALEAWRDWRASSLGREHLPVYDVPFLVVCPDDEPVDLDRLAHWFYRSNVSYLAAETSALERTDVPIRQYRSGFHEISWLLPPDERTITKYDRDMFGAESVDRTRIREVEKCSIFTLPYWLGRYHGVIIDEGDETHG